MILNSYKCCKPFYNREQRAFIFSRNGDSLDITIAFDFHANCDTRPITVIAGNIECKNLIVDHLKCNNICGDNIKTTLTIRANDITANALSSTDIRARSIICKIICSLHIEVYNSIQSSELNCSHIHYIE